MEYQQWCGLSTGEARIELSRYRRDSLTIEVMVEFFKNYWLQHGWVGVLAAWAVVSSVLNLAFRLKPAEFWIELGKNNPKLAGIAKSIQAGGIDPWAAIKALGVYFAEAKKDAEADK